MTSHKLKTAFLTALLGVGLVAPSANAVVTAYGATDLLLGFTRTGSTNSYVLNLGKALQYRTASGQIVLNTSAVTANGDGAVTGIGSAANISSDIASVLGSATWATDGTVQWGIVGTSGAGNVGVDPVRDPARTLYATSASSTPTDGAYFRDTTASQTGATNSIINMANSGAETSYGGSTITGVLSPVGLRETSSFTNSWLSYQPDGANSTSGSFSYFDPSVLATISGGTSTLNLFRVQASNLGVTGGQAATSAGTDLGQLLGTFVINNTGTIVFNPVSAVPEPSRALLLVGGLASFFLRRRRPAANA